MGHPIVVSYFKGSLYLTKELIVNFLSSISIFTAQIVAFKSFPSGCEEQTAIKQTPYLADIFSLNQQSEIVCVDRRV